MGSGEKIKPFGLLSAGFVTPSQGQAHSKW